MVVWDGKVSGVARIKVMSVSENIAYKELFLLTVAFKLKV